MAGNIQIPQDVEKPVIVEVKDNSFTLKKFLMELLNEVETLKARVDELENGN